MVEVKKNEVKDNRPLSPTDWVGNVERVSFVISFAIVIAAIFYFVFCFYYFHSVA